MRFERIGTELGGVVEWIGNTSTRIGHVQTAGVRVKVNYEEK